MHVPDLSSLSLSPPDVDAVGVEGPQCDPRARSPGLCIIMRPSEWTLSQAAGLIPPHVNRQTTGLAFRINPSSLKWRTETVYDTLYRSHQFSAFTRILGRVPSFTLTYRESGGKWVAVPEQYTWFQLVSRNLIRANPKTARRGKFWLKLRYLIPPTLDKQNTARVLKALYEYNEKHPPMWALEEHERKEAAAKTTKEVAPSLCAEEHDEGPSCPPPPPPPPPPRPPSPPPAPAPAPEPAPRLPTLEELMEEAMNDKDDWMWQSIEQSRIVPDVEM